MTISRLALRCAFLFSLAALPVVAQVTDPHITSWQTTKSAQYARVYETAAKFTSGTTVTTWPSSGLTNGGGGVSTVTYSDVQRVAYSANYVYVTTTGLASYTMGNWLTPNGQTYTSWPANRAAIHRIPRTPSIPTTKQKNNGNGGVLVNGVFVWQNGDAQSYANASSTTTSATISMGGDGIWNRLAGAAETFNFDPANGHQPSSGAYHNHINPKALRYQLGDNVTYNGSTKTYSESGTPTTHSPIIGWANDGLPIYGPYGYSTATDAASGIRRMVSGFVKRNAANATAYGTVDLAVTGRHTLPVWAASVQGISAALSSGQYGPTTTATYSQGPTNVTCSIGTFAEDYEYLGDLGKVQGTDFDLNRQNVRYGVTPEYPGGTYAYFVCIDSGGNTVFPDVINQEYFGTASVGTGTVNSISETVTEYSDAGPAAAIIVTATASSSNVALAWNSAEGATYKAESSPDNSTWTTLSSTITSGGLTTSYTATTNTNYYRITLTAIASYDTGGTYGTAIGKTGTVLYGTAATAPSISTQPASATVTAGTSVTFTVVASGTGTLSYQWKKAGANISGATSASYTIASPQTTDAGSYTVAVTNSVGTTTSSAATLTVNAAATVPGITTQPTSLTVTTGASATFTVVASGTAPLSYQWQKGGVAIGGATSASYTIASAQAADAGSYACVVTNAAGSATTNTVTLTVSAAAVAPSIATQPVSLTVTTGASATFTVVANGTAPLSYQWQKGGAAIGGATAASYTMASAQAADAGSYACVVTNSAGSATTSTVTLTVSTVAVAPSISAQSASLTVTAGNSAGFSVVANGTAPLTYQWQKGGVAIGGATSAIYTIGSVQAADAGNYACVVANSVGSVTSTAVTLTVNAAVIAPAMTTQPSSATVTTGGSATFTVVASGTAPLTYQWWKGGVAIGGATAASYAIASAQAADAGSYSCVVTNSAGNATSNTVTLTVSTATVAPSIATQPASTTGVVGSNVTFTVVVNGTAPFSFQWYKGVVAINGATADNYTLTAVQPPDAGSYTCVITNSVGSATSNAATLTVTFPVIVPSIATQPASTTVTAGGSATFTVVASGTAPLSFQWQKGGVAIGGATAQSYTIASAQAADAGNYLCVVTNSAGSATSGAATLTVTSVAVAPSIATQPVSATVTAGGSATFTIVANGTAPLSYQWQKGGVAIAGATAANYVITGVQAASAGNYTCVVTNSVGSATSNIAGLTVTTATIAPIITTQPAAATVTVGGDTTFTVVASGTATLTYQWYKGVAAIGGATTASYAIASVQVADAGSYTCVITNSTGIVTSDAATLTVNDAVSGGSTSGGPGSGGGTPAAAPVARIINLAVRAAVGGTAGTPITGFVLSGTGTGKRLIVRAVGPTLGTFGVAGTLADPQLQLFSGNTLLASNDNWSATDAPAFVAVGAFPLDTASSDAAIVTTLAPGTYSTPVLAGGGSRGTVLIECYDGASADTSVRLVNASARAFVGAGGDVLIPGFVISGAGSVRLLLRAVGPRLIAFGLSGVLLDPQITLYRLSTPLASNDNWSDAANAAEVESISAQAGAFSLAAGSNDAALLVTLTEGAYTAVVSGVNNATGTALVEIYVVP